MALFKGGEYSTAELADLFGVARSTVYRASERERARVSTIDRHVVPQATPLRDSNILLASETSGRRSWFPGGFLTPQTL